jgi:hypothetical protein
MASVLCLMHFRRLLSAAHVAASVIALAHGQQNYQTTWQKDDAYRTVHWVWGSASLGIFQKWGVKHAA